MNPNNLSCANFLQLLRSLFGYRLSAVLCYCYTLNVIRNIQKYVTQSGLVSLLNDLKKYLKKKGSVKEKCLEPVSSAVVGRQS